MKTTLNLNDELVTRAKTVAAQHHTSLTRLTEEGLQLRLQAAPRSHATRLPTHAGKGGLAPGLCSLRNKDLLDAADERPGRRGLDAASRSDHPHHVSARHWLQAELAEAAAPVPCSPW